jgi:putative two-component system response regulator
MGGIRSVLELVAYGSAGQVRVARAGAAVRGVAEDDQTPRILIVDHEEASIHVLERLLQQATPARLRSAADSNTAIALFADFQPDLVLVDLHMPHADVFTVLEALRGLIPADTYLPLVALTADTSPMNKQRIVSSGAADFLIKPFDPCEVRLRITNLLRSRALYRESQGHTRDAQARTRELGDAHLETVERLALAIEYREDGTGGHTRRVGHLAARLAQSLGLAEATVQKIRLAAPLHDVGKIAIPDRILLKPAPLAPEEWQVMKTHTTEGAKIVAGGRHSLLLAAETIALNHHERWDGYGYPRGLRGEAIPLPARIVAVADAFDAMTHPRPYRAALRADEALAELDRYAGAQFDPRCVEHFLMLVNELESRTTRVLRSGEERQRT